MSQILGVFAHRTLERMLKYVSFEHGHDDKVDHRNGFLEVPSLFTGKQFLQSVQPLFFNVFGGVIILYSGGSSKACAVYKGIAVGKADISYQA